MKGTGRLVLAMVVVLALALAACAPTAAPKPAEAAPTAAPKPPAATPSPSAKEVMDALAAAAKKEGKVTIYASTGTPDAMRALGDAFKAAYGVTVEWVVTRGAESLQRITTEQQTKVYTADVVYAGPGVWPGLKEAGYIVSVDLPVAAESGVWRLSPYDFDPKDRKLIMGNISVTPGGMGVLINTKLVPPDKEPKSWLDLLDPFWKGKMIIDDPTIPGPGSDLFTIWRVKGIVPKDYFDKLATQDIKLFRGYPQQAEMVAKGEFAAGIVAFPLYALPHIAAGLPVKAAWLKEGIYNPPMALALVANARNPNAGRLFINWLLTKEAQTIWHSTEKSLSMRSDVPDYTPDALKIPSGVPSIRQSYDEIVLTVKELEQGLAGKLFKK